MFGPGAGDDNRPNMLRWWWVLLAFMVAWFIFPLLFDTGDQGTEISYSRFLEQVDQGNVEQVLITGDVIEGTLDETIEITTEDTEEGEPIEVTEFRTVFPQAVGDDELVDRLLAQGAEVETESPSQGVLQALLVNLLPFLLLIAVFVWFARRARQSAGGGLFNFGRSKPRRYTPSRVEVTFEDVAGQDQAKSELEQIVDFLASPEKYHDIGAKLPHGVLLVGPPGTGKTLLARAVAGEAGVPFFNLSATEFVEMFVGVGASRVRDLFEKATKAAPAIIFIDELDAVGRRRGAGVGQQNDEREQTLNQLLNQMDGFDERAEVIVLAATNRPDVLDPALLRPGRFDREVVVGLPDRNGREGIIRIHTADIELSEEVDIEQIARRTIGMSGADLANVCNEAALIAASGERESVTYDDFDEAIDKIMMGGEREAPLSEDERRLIAYHESGHALVGWLTPRADPIHKVTIVPHGRAGGATTQLPEEDRTMHQREYILAKIAVLLAGRASEELAVKDVSTGAEQDLVQATRLARRMVTRWGMGSLAPMAYQTDDEQPFLGYELTQHSEVSQETAARIDSEVERIIVEQYETVSQLLSSRQEDLDRLVERLMDEETVDDTGLTELLGPATREESADAASAR